VSGIKFYLDVHIPKAVAHGLAQRGQDVLRCVEAGQGEAPDLEILGFALSQGRVVFTRDSDFLALHQQNVPHAGIAFLPSNPSIGEIIRFLMLIGEVLEAEDMKNHVEFI